MRSRLLTILVGACLASAIAPLVHAQAASDSELTVSYSFWSPAKFSVGPIEDESVMGVFSTSLDPLFMHNFEKGSAAEKAALSAQRKYNIGNWGLAVAAGVAFAVAINVESSKLPWILAGSGLALGDILIGVSAYRDLQRAADLRNAAIGPTLSLKF